MKITLQSVEIRNFKGIESINIGFSDRVRIFGRNATGKTTVQDAFLWCLFGKDSSGASDFSVKPKFENGKDKPHLDVDVLCVLEVDGQTKSLRRRLVEKWGTPRGASEPEFKGNTGEFFVNDVPVSATEYNKQISQICDEEIFKLVTTAGAFNKMKDADRRRILSSMADNISDVDLAADFPAVLEALQSGKTLQQFRDEIKSKKKRVSDEKEQYPARLKENADMCPDPVDFDSFAKEEKDVIASIAGIEKKLSSENGDLFAQQEKERLLKEIKDIESQLDDISSSLTKERNQKKANLESHLEGLRSEYDHETASHKRSQDMFNRVVSDISKHEESMNAIRENWKKENARTCEVTIDNACPTCGTVFDESKLIEKKNEIIQAFNDDKLRALERIRKQGDSESEYISALKIDKDKIGKEIVEISGKLESISKYIHDVCGKISELPSVQLLLSANLEYQGLKNKRDELICNLNVEVEPNEAKDELKNNKVDLEARLVFIRKELSKKGEIERADQRKNELLDRQAELGQLVAEYEAIEHQILQFSMLRTEIIEKSIADKFRFVKFKMFDYNITNDGVKEVCVCTVNGVPYNDLNTAMQINADIDIINALSKHYHIYAPVFIDHAESINIIEGTLSQRIDLYATMDDDKLRIEQIS